MLMYWLASPLAAIVAVVVMAIAWRVHNVRCGEGDDGAR